MGLGPTSQAPPSPRFEGPYTLTFELSAACGDLAGLRYEWDLQGTQGESAALLTLPREGHRPARHGPHNLPGCDG